MKRISKQYFRDTKCEEIERMLHENPNYSGWIVQRFSSSMGISDFEDSFEIQNEKGSRIVELTESELDLAIAMDTLEFILEHRLRMGFLRNFSPRVICILITVVLVVPLIVMIPVVGYIMSLPTELALLSFVLLFCVLGGLCCILYISQEHSNRKRIEPRRWTDRSRYERTEVPSEYLKESENLMRMKTEDPQQYIQKLKDLAEKHTASEGDMDDEFETN